MGKWSLRLGWALMTETLIKWRRDLLYCHPSHNLCPPPHKLCCSSFGDLNSNFLEIKMTYSSKNLSRYMIQKEKKKIKTEVGWNFCQLMKTLDFWALCREIPLWWLLPMCKFFCIIFAILVVFVCLYFSCLSAQEAAMSQWGPPLVNNIQRCIETTQDALTLNCHAVTAIADKSISFTTFYLVFVFLFLFISAQHSTVTLSQQMLTRVYLCR